MVVPLVVAVGFSWWGGRVGVRKHAKKPVETPSS